MDTTASLSAPCTPVALYPWIEDLAMYPRWTDLVHVAEAESLTRPVSIGAERPAWTIELRGRVGPFARSKRLRMVRTLHVPTSEVRFERVELDGRRHAMWSLTAVLTAEISPLGSDGEPRTRLDMHLHYDGALWTGGVLEKALADQIERGRARLVLLTAGVTPRPTQSSDHPIGDQAEG